MVVWSVVVRTTTLCDTWNASLKLWTKWGQLDVARPTLDVAASEGGGAEWMHGAADEAIVTGRRERREGRVRESNQSVSQSVAIAMIGQ